MAKGPIPLNESDLVHEIGLRLPGTPESQIRKFLTAFKDEVTDCIISGYKVNLTGLCSFEPVVKAGRKKGTQIRNPFKPDEPPKTLRADEPDKFMVKIKKSPSLTAKFPTVRSGAGQDLHEQLAGKPRARRKAA